MPMDAIPPARTSVLDDVPPARRRRRTPWVILPLLVLVLAALWVAVGRPSLAWSNAGPVLRTVEVDRGDMAIVVVESGTLESANNTTVKCKVEALLGQVGGSSGTAGQSGAGGGGGATGSLTSAGSTGGAAAASATAATKAGAAAATKAGAAAATSGAAAATTATRTATAGTATAVPVPVIRSFTMQIVPHVPLRPRTAATSQTKTAPRTAFNLAGGGGGGGRGGSSSSPETMERPGSTRILWILPEGTQVRAGDVVCELDSAAFRDQLAAQGIRHEQAKAWVEQAKTILEVSQISLSEYRDGIYPQDTALIRQYIATCQTELRRTKAGLDWSRGAQQKSVRTESQVRVDQLTFERAEIALSDAMGMQRRLEKYTAPRLIKSLEAKIEAVRADLLTQQAAFQVEDERLRRLRAMIAFCSMTAPREGIVVYANPSNRWGRVEDQIREGVTVREGQAIFNLPDPNRMCVKVRVNESKVSLIRPGQRAEIRVDAFPDRPLRGTVAEVTPIPAPASGPISDIKVYFATVSIDSGGFADLRPGLSAEVTFLVGTRRGATLVPIPTIRWSGPRAFAAQESPDGPRWQPVELGVFAAGSAEVLEGLKPGDRVIADPTTLPPPPLATQGPR